MSKTVVSLKWLGLQKVFKSHDVNLLICAIILTYNYCNILSLIKIMQV